MRRFIVVMLLLALVAGCSKPVSNPTPPAPPSPGEKPTAGVPAPPPAGDCISTAYAPDTTPGIAPKPAPAGTEERPGIQLASISFAETDGPNGRLTGTRYFHRSGTAAVGLDRFVLHINLQPAPSAGWHRLNVKVGDAAPDPFRPELLANGTVELGFSKVEQPGRVTVTLSNVTLWDGSVGDFTLYLCRQPEPTAELLFKAGSQWTPVTGTETLPPGPITLKLAFSQPMDKSSVGYELFQEYGVKEGNIERQIAWEDEKTAIITLPKPPPLLLLNVNSVRSAQGVNAVGGLPGVHAGEPARLVVVDPATGKERAVATVPPEISEGRLAPDGTCLRLRSMRVSTGSSPLRAVEWAVDLASGRLGELGQPGTPDCVAEPAPVSIPAEHRQWGSTWATSPDGTRVAVLKPGEVIGSAPSGRYRRTDLVVLDRGGKELFSLPGVGAMWLPKGGYGIAAPVWSPDGQRIYFVSDSQDSRGTLKVVEAKPGATADGRTALDGVGATYPLSFSPDGKLLAVGNLLIDTSVWRIWERLHTERVTPVWSPDGQWVLHQTYPWTTVWAHSLQSHRARELGTGMALGWTKNGEILLIRWPNSDRQFHWGI